ncbi:MAG: beta-eliminating lyase-related protein [Pseudomonadota bacterium]|nr:beta-eliminating lyase-related protein [Pseudomonadota bacterium]
MNLCSDNEAPVAPQILEAISEANNGFARSYGEDQLTRKLKKVFSKIFEREVEIFPVVTGTAANALALGHVTPPYGAIYCTPHAHILVDECGAPGFFSGGASMVKVNSVQGKIDLKDFQNLVDNWGAHGDHEPRPCALSVTQTTEVGTVYTAEEICKLSQLAHHHNMVMHMDGARFANAVASLECSPADMTWRAGVDVLSFGATKNGALAAEAVVFFKEEHAREFGRQRMRGGHLLSKMRFVSAQLLAYLEEGLWLDLASQSNGVARRLRDGLVQLPGVDVIYEVEGNAVFACLPEKMLEGLLAEGYLFHRWPGKVGLVRLMCSYSLRKEEIDDFLEAARLLA